jgi:hypothetical protein
MPLYLNAFPVGRVTSRGEVIQVVPSKEEPKLIISPGVSALPNSDVSRSAFGAIIEATPDLKSDSPLGKGA